jgi:hypothetical protein
MLQLGTAVALILIEIKNGGQGERVQKNSHSSNGSKDALPRIEACPG